MYPDRQTPRSAIYSTAEGKEAVQRNGEIARRKREKQRVHSQIDPEEQLPSHAIPPRRSASSRAGTPEPVYEEDDYSQEEVYTAPPPPLQKKGRGLKIMGGAAAATLAVLAIVDVALPRIPSLFGQNHNSQDTGSSGFTSGNSSDLLSIPVPSGFKENPVQAEAVDVNGQKGVLIRAELQEPGQFLNLITEPNNGSDTTSFGVVATDPNILPKVNGKDWNDFTSVPRWPKNKGQKEYLRLVYGVPVTGTDGKVKPIYAEYLVVGSDGKMPQVGAFVSNAKDTQVAAAVFTEIGTENILTTTDYTGSDVLVANTQSAMDNYIKTQINPTQ